MNTSIPHVSKLPKEQQEALAALCEAGSTRLAAARMGVSFERYDTILNCARVTLGAKHYLHAALAYDRAMGRTDAPR